MYAALLTSSKREALSTQPRATISLASMLSTVVAENTVAHKDYIFCRILLNFIALVISKGYCMLSSYPS